MRVNRWWIIRGRIYEPYSIVSNSTDGNLNIPIFQYLHYIKMNFVQYPCNVWKTFVLSGERNRIAFAHRTGEVVKFVHRLYVPSEPCSQSFIWCEEQLKIT